MLREEYSRNVAMMILGKRLAKEMNIDLSWPVSRICAKAGIARPYAYELVNKLLATLTTSPEESEASGKAEVDSRGLTLRVLRYQVEHPGAVIGFAKRTTYSLEFRRFILELFDAAEVTMTQEEFADAVEVPLDTLRNWLATDRNELEQQVTARKEMKAALPIPLEANPLTLELVELYQAYEGSTRDFIPYAARVLQLPPKAVRKVLRILGVIVGRKRKAPRYRGSTEPLDPGAMAVTDAKDVNVDTGSSDEWAKRAVHAFVDQRTGTILGTSAKDNECAEGYEEAWRSTKEILGGPPLGVLRDNKPCFDNEELEAVLGADSEIVAATPARGENKAVIEGTFSDFESHVGTITLDDSSMASAITTAVGEAFRAYAAGRNHAQCLHCDGPTRMAVLQSHCPSKEKQRQDLAFIQRLRREHERRFAYSDEISKQLLDEGFQYWNLLDKDPTGAQRSYLSYCEPAAVRRAFAIYATKAERKVLNEKFAHRYLAKLVQSCQYELDLEHAENELLRLNRIHRFITLEGEEAAYRQILKDFPEPAERCRRIAEKALANELPIVGAFWRSKLQQEVVKTPDTAPAIRTYIKRYYEAELNPRIALLDLVIQTEMGLATTV